MGSWTSPTTWTCMWRRTTTTMWTQRRRRTTTWTFYVFKRFIMTNFGENADKCRHCAKVFLCRRSLKIHMVTTHWRKAFCMWNPYQEKWKLVLELRWLASPFENGKQIVSFAVSSKIKFASWRNTCPPHPPPCWLNSQPTCPCCSPPLLSHPLCCFFPLAYTYPGLRWCPSPRPRKWLWFQFWNFPSNIQFIYSFPLREIPPCWPPSQPHSQPTCPSPHSWPLPPPWLPCQTTCTSPHPWPPPS